MFAFLYRLQFRSPGPIKLHKEDVPQCRVCGERPSARLRIRDCAVDEHAPVVMQCNLCAAPVPLGRGRGGSRLAAPVANAAAPDGLLHINNERVIHHNATHASTSLHINTNTSNREGERGREREDKYRERGTTQYNEGYTNTQQQHKQPNTHNT